VIAVLALGAVTLLPVAVRMARKRRRPAPTGPEATGEKKFPNKPA